MLDRIKNKFGGVRYGKYVMICCPYHDDTHPSMQVYQDWATCKACDARVPTERLLEDFSYKIKIRSTDKPFYNPFTIWMRDESLFECLKIAYKRNCSSPSAYLKGRRIEPDDQKRLKLGSRDLWHTFPILNAAGSVLGATARAGQTNTSPHKYVCPKDQDPNLLYVPDWSLLSNKLYLTFGILDAVSLSLLGKFAASTTTGKSLNHQTLDWFKGIIIIVPDFREEAEAYKLKYKITSSIAEVWMPNYPTGCKDINDLFIHHKGKLIHELERAY